MTLSPKRFLLVLFVLSTLLSWPAAGACESRLDGPLRAPMLAGSWYPADPAALRSQVEGYLKRAQLPDVPPGDVTAIVVPHAGLQYSGWVAAYAYQLLRGRDIKTVVMLGPSHRYRFEGFALWEKGGFDSPLGVAQVDSDLAQALKDQEPFLWHMSEAHLAEHSLEIQLPFIKTVLPDAKIVPIIMCEQSFSAARRLAISLAKVLEGRRDVLIVATTDLSHYYNSKTAAILDGEFIKRVKHFDPTGVWEALVNRKCEACGAGPTLAAMMASGILGAKKVAILKYADSGATTGDRERVVGYMAAAFIKKRGEARAKEKIGVDLGLSKEDKALLKSRALQIIEAKLKGRDPESRGVISPRLYENRGAFVTLNKEGRLRGCIGYIEATKPLIEAVEGMAVSAAFHDPRFSPLEEDELKEIELEISVLTPLERVKDLKDIRVGVHGLYMKREGKSGLLLPQVAVEYGWDAEEFLYHTCKKAGMEGDCWRDDGTEIYVFSADVF